MCLETCSHSEVPGTAHRETVPPRLWEPTVLELSKLWGPRATLPKCPRLSENTAPLHGRAGGRVG